MVKDKLQTFEEKIIFSISSKDFDTIEKARLLDKRTRASFCRFGLLKYAKEVLENETKTRG